MQMHTLANQRPLSGEKSKKNPEESVESNFFLFPGLFYKSKHLKWDFSNTLLLFELKLGTDNSCYMLYLHALVSLLTSI